MNGKSMSKWKNLEIIGKPYALDILETISKSPKRYSDLKEVCPVDKTRTKRLRELELLGLTETINKKIEEKDRTFIHYRLTKRGKNIVSIALKMLEKEN
ncbi:winged helix-turn-helix transcriptional regulator [Candidatus Woesearchaeota archaeon]|nr:winged helix-turn-helix transcriptional regulator [Candidatus Woesearchaeota archaeon]